MTSKQQQWRIPLKNPVDSGKTFFDISVNSVQNGRYPQKMTATCTTYATFRQRSGYKVIDEQRKNLVARQ